MQFLQSLLLHVLACGSFLATAPVQASPATTYKNQLINDADLIAKLPSGRTYQGFYRNPTQTVRSFLGIPFAAPPVGKLRFRPPQPLPHADKDKEVIYPATEYGKTCHNYRYRLFYRDDHLKHKVDTRTEESEDCLTLNVWAPAMHWKGKHDELLPVMVWIHGGNFQEGGASLPLYDGANIVQEHQDIIVVSIQYRLNLFGFPFSKSIPLNETNLGLLDQRFALEWLRDNLHIFGGDSKKITLFGQSAGSESVGAYKFAYAEDPIVRAYIMQSGQPEDIGNGIPTEFTRVAHNVGCSGFESGSPEELECMRSVDAEKLKHGISNLTVNPPDQTALPGGRPVVDNVTNWSPQDYYQRAATGKFSLLPTLLGATLNEGDSLIPYDWDKGINYTISDITTDSIMHCPTASFAGFNVKNNVTTWRYLYMGILPWATPAPWLRAYHVAEIGMVFGNFFPYYQHTVQEFERGASKYIMAAWVAFAKDPYNGLSKAPFNWPKYNPKERTIVNIFPDYMSRSLTDAMITGKERMISLGDPNVQDKTCENPPKSPGRG